MSGYEELIASKATPEPQTVDTPPAAEVVVEQAPAPEPAPSEAPPPPPQDPMAPVKALLDERDRRQAAERKAAELEAWRRAQEERARKATEQMPHPLDDPDGFAHWLLQRQQTAVQREVGTLSQRHQQQVEVISKNMMARYLGPEKFGDLHKFIDAAPDQAHAIALKQADPYGWFYEKFEQAQKAKAAEEALKLVSEKPIEQRIAEAIAAERAKWEAEHGGGQPQPAAQPAPPADNRARNPDGTFASTSNQTQRHQPPSLSVVAAAPSPRGEDARGGYDALFKRG